MSSAWHLPGYPSAPQTYHLYGDLANRPPPGASNRGKSFWATDTLAGYISDGIEWFGPFGGGSGTVTSITAGDGLTGGTITNTGTIAVNYSTVANNVANFVDTILANQIFGG